MGHTLKVIEGASDFCGTEGQVERLYWREGELWIRMRTAQGRWLSLPWRETDLPQLKAYTPSQRPLLSPRALLKLTQHLQRYTQKPSRRMRKKG